MAAYFEVDPVIVRLLWIVALLTGVGFFAYLVCWVAIPKAKVWPPDGYAQALPRDTRASAMLSGLMIVGLAALIGQGVDGLGGMLLPAALVGFGMYLLNERAGASAQVEAPTMDAAPAAPAADGVSAPWPPAASASPEHYTRSSAVSASGADPSSGLVTPAVLSLLAIAAGVAWVLAAAGLVQLTVVGMASAALVVVGLGLLASLWLGRAQGLPLLGMGLTALLVVASAAEPLVERAREFRADNFSQLKLDHFRGVAGDRRFEPQSLAELQPVYGLGMGELTVDLSELDFTDATRDVEIQLGLGKATVIVPDDVNLQVSGQVALGKAVALDLVSEGANAAVDLSDPALNAGTLRVKFSVGLGEGMVRREE
jgi:hypothetical protein